MEGKFKETYFAKYCPVCVYKNIKETKDPCNECLGEGARIDSHRPLHYKPIAKGSDTNGGN